MDLTRLLKRGLRNTILLKGGTHFSYEGMWKEVQQDLTIDSLIEKVKNEEVNELIFALSATMEADTTNFYIYKLLSQYSVKTSTIARGIPVGDELEYTDEVTLGRSILARIPFEASISKS